MYSSAESGVKKGSSSLFNYNSGQFSVIDSKSRRPILSTGDLANADLNVAKIRLVSTIPDKPVDDSTTPTNKKVENKAYVGFILSAVQEQHAEKMQVVSLPGDAYASYFYGSQPRQFSFQGILLNTAEDQWRDAFEQMYEKYLRGSAASRRFNMVQVSYDNRVVSGWLTSMSQQVSSASDTYNSFSFTMLVSRIDIIGGNKELFLNYMTKQQGILTDSNIEADFAVLNNKNYNALVNPVRTGMMKTPPRPKRGGKRSRPTNDCPFTRPTGQGGQPNNAGGPTISTDFRTTAECTITEAFIAKKQEIDHLEKQLEEAKKDSSKATQEDVMKLRAEYARQINLYNEKAAELQDELQAEYHEALTRKGDAGGNAYSIKDPSKKNSSTLIKVNTFAPGNVVTQNEYGESLNSKVVVTASVTTLQQNQRLIDDSLAKSRVRDEAKKAKEKKAKNDRDSATLDNLLNSGE